MSEPKKTQLNALHRELGGKMVEFGGYDMPVQFPSGVLKEHLHTRAACGLFDVSHMGQGALKGDGVAAAFEALCPGAIQELKPGQTRYTLLLNDQGGIRDDLMVTRPLDDNDFRTLFLVVNAGTKDADFAHIGAHLLGLELSRLEDRALLALQGPQAVAGAWTRIVPRSVAAMKLHEHGRTVDRHGSATAALHLALGLHGRRRLRNLRARRDAADGLRAGAARAKRRSLPIGLGARDSLRLEGGPLPLRPRSSTKRRRRLRRTLTWAIGKRRKLEKEFPGRRAHHHDPAVQRREPACAWGIKPLEKVGRRLAKAARVRSDVRRAPSSAVITSGGFGPSVNGAHRHGLCVTEMRRSTVRSFSLMVRGQKLPAPASCRMPFIFKTLPQTLRSPMTETRYTDQITNGCSIDGAVATVGITALRGRATRRRRLRRIAQAIGTCGRQPRAARLPSSKA